jgi:DNA-binding MarR family transcriptional regulator
MEGNHIVVRSSLTTKEYQHLLALRTGLRRFLHWSEEQAHSAGLTPSHHQLLLAVRGHDDPRGPTIGDVADYLLLRHHSAVELAQRAEGLGLIQRVADPDDGRVVRLVLTDRGSDALEQLTALHVEELARLADDLRPVWDGLGTTADDGV